MWFTLKKETQKNKIKIQNSLKIIKIFLTMIYYIFSLCFFFVFKVNLWSLVYYRVQVRCVDVKNMACQQVRVVGGAVMCGMLILFVYHSWKISVKTISNSFFSMTSYETPHPTSNILSVLTNGPHGFVLGSHTWFQNTYY
jgi:hypothetical protein